METTYPKQVNLLEDVTRPLLRDFEVAMQAGDWCIDERAVVLHEHGERGSANYVVVAEIERWDEEDCGGCDCCCDGKSDEDGFLCSFCEEGHTEWLDEVRPSSKVLPTTFSGYTSVTAAARLDAVHLFFHLPSPFGIEAF